MQGHPTIQTTLKRLQPVGSWSRQPSKGFLPVGLWGLEPEAILDSFRGQPFHRSPFFPKLDVEFDAGQTGERRGILIGLGWAGAAMRQQQLETAELPLRRQAADALRQARKLPVGHARNDLRQLALGLRWLEKRGFVAVVQDRDGILEIARKA